MNGIISVRIGEDMEKELVIVERKMLVERSEIIRRLLTESIKQWKINNALEELTAHKISLGKAAEMAKVSIWEMMDIVKDKKIDWIGLSPEDIEKDLEIVKKLSKK
ncbi:MAG: UPF0175 family protein [Nanoarchaeota archaeon]